MECYLQQTRVLRRDRAYEYPGDTVMFLSGAVRTGTNRHDSQMQCHVSSNKARCV
jgi:hypothetical protein